MDPNTILNGFRINGDEQGIYRDQKITPIKKEKNTNNCLLQ